MKSFKKIKDLLDLMNENNLTEIEIEEDGLKIRLQKGRPPSEAVVITGGGDRHTETAEVQEEAAGTDTVNAPMVGTFYASPSPEAPRYIDVGNTVTTDTIVCIIEAMKVMNEIKAGVAGEVLEVLADSGSPIEYGTPLFRIKPA